MHFNQFSYLAFSSSQLLNELEKLGLNLTPHLPSKKQFEHFIRWSFFTYSNTDYALSTISIDKDTDFLTFCQSDRELTADIFYTVAFQLLGFLTWLTLKTVMFFVKRLVFPLYMVT